jgi:hypothetical protein
MIENGGDAGANAESVLRRYEFYKYTGGVDPENGEALSDVPVLNPDGSPVLGGNIGAFIGDQNVAVNLNGVFNGPPQVAAPEPSSLALVAWGLIGLATLRRRQSGLP